MSPFRLRLTCLMAGVFLCGVVQAAPITFNFHFASPNSSAQTIGHITFDDALLTNPGNTNFDLPDPAVLALNVTVSGATTGNGTFTIDDFCSVVFATSDATLDLNRQLVGQPTPGSLWGTPDENGGDFNLFACDAPSGTGAPDGIYPFALIVDSGGQSNDDDVMELLSMLRAGTTAGDSVSIPTLSWHALLLLAGLMGLFGMWTARRNRQI